MLQTEHMPDLVQRYVVQLDRTERLARIEGDPAVEEKAVGQLRSGRNGSGLEELALPVDQLNRAVLTVVLVLVQVENAGPRIHRVPKLFRENLIRRSHSHPKIHMSLPQQFRVPIAGRIIRTPIRGTPCVG